MSFIRFAAHFLVAAVAFAVAFRQGTTVGSFMRLSVVSRIGVPGFFFFTGLGQLCIGLQSADWLLSVVTLLQALLLVCMLIGTLTDARRAVLRFSNAMGAIRAEFDGLAVVHGEYATKLIEDGKAEILHVGETMIATVDFALYGDGETPGSTARKT